MKKVLLSTILSLFLLNCQSSDNGYEDLSTQEIHVTHIGVDRVRISSRYNSAVSWMEYRAKGETIFTKAKKESTVVSGLKPGKTYEFRIANEKYVTPVIRVTTKAIELDYQRIRKETSCSFERREIKTKRSYTLYTQDQIQHDHIDMYLLNHTLTDSIKVNTRIGEDKKSFTFTVPDDVFIDSSMPKITYLGFKIGDKMDYYFGSFFDKGFYDYEQNRYVPLSIYNNLKYNLGPGFFVENITPNLERIYVAKKNGYAALIITGRMFDYVHYGITKCDDHIEAVASTLVFYKEDQQTVFLDVSNNKGDARPISKLNTFEVFVNRYIVDFIKDYTSLQGMEIQYYTNLFPEGTYYVQYKVRLADGGYVESNKIEFVCEGITP
ncbi:fibronectin type III domain-containing protein [Myroides sp. C15-4]|uniref:fibronectin type III domain-containing protein n=1 Tax=Myroides sp. C15-4 TaxID=3400532 RepID=UPI003D2F631F